MSAPESPDPEMLRAARFAATPWTDVLLARELESPEARKALERLCCLYWYPIYAHIRQQVSGAHDAEDLTQEFFALLLEKNYLGAADRKRSPLPRCSTKALALLPSHFPACVCRRGASQEPVEQDLARQSQKRRPAPTLQRRKILKTPRSPFPLPNRFAPEPW